MSQGSFSAIAALAALAFLAMALSACASSAPAAQSGEDRTAAIETPQGLPEFHGAHIGGDALRSRLPGE